jgi:hypothetical protein
MLKFWIGLIQAIFFMRHWIKIELAFRMAAP